MYLPEFQRLFPQDQMRYENYLSQKNYKIIRRSYYGIKKTSRYVC